MRLIGKKTKKFTIFFLIGMFFVLRYTGFCFSKMAYVSDEDFFVTLLKSQVTSGGDMDLASDDATLRGYVRRNIDCCRIIENPPDKNWFEILFFDSYRRVIVRYPLKANRVPGDGSKYYWVLAYMGSCCELGQETGTFGGREL